jgi:hypothetical protein
VELGPLRRVSIGEVLVWAQLVSVSFGVFVLDALNPSGYAAFHGNIGRRVRWLRAEGKKLNSSFNNFVAESLEAYLRCDAFGKHHPIEKKKKRASTGGFYPEGMMRQLLHVIESHIACGSLFVAGSMVAGAVGADGADATGADAAGADAALVSEFEAVAAATASLDPNAIRLLEEQTSESDKAAQAASEELQADVHQERRRQMQLLLQDHADVAAASAASLDQNEGPPPLASPHNSTPLIPSPPLPTATPDVDMAGTQELSQVAPRVFPIAAPPPASPMGTHRNDESAESSTATMADDEIPNTELTNAEARREVFDVGAMVKVRGLTEQNKKLKQKHRTHRHANE